MPFDKTIPRQEIDATFEVDSESIAAQISIANAPDTAAFELYRVNPNAKPSPKAKLIEPPGQVLVSQSPTPKFTVIPRDMLNVAKGLFVECHAVLVGEGVPAPRLTCRLWQASILLAELSYENDVEQVLAFRLVLAEAGEI